MTTTAGSSGSVPIPGSDDGGDHRMWESRPDADIELELRTALDERTDSDDITLLVADGVVNLTGRLDRRLDTEVVRRRATAVIGVRRVNAWLTSTEETGTDETGIEESGSASL